MKKAPIHISLDILQEGMPAISKAIGKYLAEGGAFCLENSGHTSGVQMEVDKEGERVVIELAWSNEIDQQTSRAWNDKQEATEYGATAIAIVLLQALSEYTIIERSFKGTGFDYWLGTGKYDEKLLPFVQRKARLEISGIWKANKNNSLSQRLQLKKRQVERSNDLGLPAVIIIAEFSQPEAKVFGI